MSALEEKLVEARILEFRDKNHFHRCCLFGFQFLAELKFFTAFNYAELRPVGFRFNFLQWHAFLSRRASFFVLLHK